MMILIQLKWISYTARKVMCLLRIFFSECNQDTVELVTTEDIFMKNFIFCVALFEK